MFVKSRYSNGVTAFIDDCIDAPHMFSTRCGGISSLPHLVSLNLGEGRGDTPENVKENFNRFLGVRGMRFGDLVRSKQIHSTNVKVVTRADAGSFFEDCDGFVTKETGVVLCVKVADCAPILLYDGKNKVIGALHAGWKGSCRGIAKEGVRAMESLGARPENIKAAIGACIHSCCYEVGQDFLSTVIACMGREAAMEYVKYKEDTRLYADIVGMNCRYLQNCGVKKENISVCDYCTCCHPELFFSHRYSHGLRGTMCAVISL